MSYVHPFVLNSFGNEYLLIPTPMLGIETTVSRTVKYTPYGPHPVITSLSNSINTSLCVIVVIPTMIQCFHPERYCPWAIAPNTQFRCKCICTNPGSFRETKRRCAEFFICLVKCDIAINIIYKISDKTIHVIGHCCAIVLIEIPPCDQVFQTNHWPAKSNFERNRRAFLT